MTVGELIAELSELDPQGTVYTEDTEEGETVEVTGAYRIEGTRNVYLLFGDFE